MEPLADQPLNFKSAAFEAMPKSSLGDSVSRFKKEEAKTHPIKLLLRNHQPIWPLILPSPASIPRINAHRLPTRIVRVTWKAICTCSVGTKVKLEVRAIQVGA